MWRRAKTKFRKKPGAPNKVGTIEWARKPVNRADLEKYAKPNYMGNATGKFTQLLAQVKAENEAGGVTATTELPQGPGTAPENLKET